MDYGPFNLVDMLEYPIKNHQPVVGSASIGIQFTVSELLEIFNWKTFVVDEIEAFSESLFSAYGPMFFYDPDGANKMVMIQSRRADKVSDMLELISAEVMANKLVFVLSISCVAAIDPVTFEARRNFTIRYATL